MEIQSYPTNDYFVPFMPHEFNYIIQNIQLAKYSEALTELRKFRINPALSNYAECLNIIAMYWRSRTNNTKRVCLQRIDKLIKCISPYDTLELYIYVYGLKMEIHYNLKQFKDVIINYEIICNLYLSNCSIEMTKYMTNYFPEEQASRAWWAYYYTKQTHQCLEIAQTEHMKIRQRLEDATNNPKSNSDLVNYPHWEYKFMVALIINDRISSCEDIYSKYSNMSLINFVGYIGDTAMSMNFIKDGSLYVLRSLIHELIDEACSIEVIIKYFEILYLIEKYREIVHYYDSIYTKLITKADKTILTLLLGLTLLKLKNIDQAD